jgi:hypothetical protein
MFPKDIFVLFSFSFPSVEVVNDVAIRPDVMLRIAAVFLPRTFQQIVRAHATP